MKKQKIFFVIFIIESFIVSLLAQLKPIEYETDSSMAPCVLDLCGKYFKSDRVLSGSLVIINLVPNPSIVQARILRRFNEDKSHEMAVMVKDSKKSHRSSRVLEKAQNYFMLLQHFNDFEATLWQLKKLPTWNPLAQIVVQFTVPFENDTLQETWTQNLFKELLSHDALKVNIMYQYKNDTNMIRVVTWFPYHNSSCPNAIANIRLIEECIVRNTIDENGRVTKRNHSVKSFNQHLYPKIPLKFNQCNLRVSTVIWEPFVVANDDDIDNEDDPIIERGLELLMLKTITQGISLNVTFYPINKERATRTITDNNRTGLYAKLLQKKADVMIGGLYENKISRKLLSSSIPFFQDDITWCVAPSDLAPKWLNVFIIFNITTWISLIFTLIFTSGILYLFVKHEGRHHENYMWSFLIMFSLSTSQYAHYDPKNVCIKIFFAGFFFFGLHISTAYHSYLINVLTNPRYMDQIDTVEKAMDFNMTFKAAENAREFFMKNDSTSKYLLKNYLVCKKLDDCFLEVVTDRRKAVAISRAHALNNPLQLKEGRDFFCFPVEDNVVIYSVVMLFQKFHHLLPIFDEKIRVILESGLLSKWEYESTRAVQKIENVSGGGSHSEGPQIKLALEHVEGAFLVVIVGLLTSLVVFLLELVICFMVKNNKYVKVSAKIENIICYA